MHAQRARARPPSPRLRTGLLPQSAPVAFCGNSRRLAQTWFFQLPGLQRPHHSCSFPDHHQHAGTQFMRTWTCSQCRDSSGLKCCSPARSHILPFTGAACQYMLGESMIVDAGFSVAIDTSSAALGAQVFFTCSCLYVSACMRLQYRWRCASLLGTHACHCESLL